MQFADPGSQRYGNDPIYARPSYPILEDAMRRPIQYRIMGVDLFGGPEYKACLDHVFEVAGSRPGTRPLPARDGRARLHTGRVVALHGDPDLKLVSTIAGETIWWVRPPDAMTVPSTSTCCAATSSSTGATGTTRSSGFPPGHGCFRAVALGALAEPSGRRAVVSFEIGFWTRREHPCAQGLRRQLDAPPRWV